MSEPKPSEQYHVSTEEIKDAMEMLGTGYELHAPHIVLEMGEGYHLEATKEEAWIKLSTTFRKVLPFLKGANLSVFIAICLGINEKGETYPAIDTLVEWTGYSRRAVIDAVQELEETGFLTIVQGIKKSNLYHIEAFAAFGEHNDPRGAKIAPVQKTAEGGAKNDTENAQNMLKIAPELESLTRTINQSETQENVLPSKKEESKTSRLSESTKQAILERGDIGFGIAADLSNQELADMNAKLQYAKNATDTFERELAFNPLPWDSNEKWKRFKRFVVGEFNKDPACFRYFASKRKNEGQFSKLPANKRIYEDPDLLIAIWPSLKTQPETTKGEHLL